MVCAVGGAAKSRVIAAKWNTAIRLPRWCCPGKFESWPASRIAFGRKFFRSRELRRIGDSSRETVLP